MYTHDEKICKESATLSLEGLVVWNKLEKQQPAIQRNTRVAGSIVEGGGTARLFQKNTTFPDELNREGEVDIEVIIVQIPYYKKDNIRDIEGKPGYVKVRADQELVEQAKEIGWKITDATRRDLKNATSSNGWVKTYKMKEATLKRMPITNTTTEKLEPILADIFSMKTEDVTITTTQVITKSTVQSDIMISINDAPFFKISYDIVTLLELTWWPTIAEEWRSRKRRWPSSTEIEKISRFCYIINKPSSIEKDNEETKELRYSFTNVERELVRMRSRHQNKVYLIFKIMFLKWIKPLDPESISSFIPKTIMFWTCEEFPSSHEMWNKDFDSMLYALTHLFLQTKEAFEKHNLPYFFINKVNVIEAIPKDTVNIVSVRITELSENLVNYLPFPMDKELNAVKQMTHLVKSAIKVFDELKTNNFAIFFRRPELLKKTSFFEVVLLFAEELKFSSFLQNPEEYSKKFLEVYNAVGRGIQKVLHSEEKDCKARGDKQGEILSTLGQELLYAFLDVAQSDQQSEHQSKKSNGAEENEQVKIERSGHIFKNVFENLANILGS